MQMEPLSDDSNCLELRAREYTLTIDPAGPWLEFRWAGGRVKLGGGAGRAEGAWTLRTVRSETPYLVAIDSAEGRRLLLECHDDRVYAWAELPSNDGAPALLVGPGLPEFERLFSPEPTALRRHRFSPADRAVTAVGSDPAFHGGHWFLSPPPFCFALEAGAGSLAVGVACDPDELSFSSFEYDGGFRLRYDRPREGAYRSPRLLLLPTMGDGYAAVDGYCRQLRMDGLAPVGTGRTPADWWYDPNFCGWGEQSYRGCALEGFKPGVLTDGIPGRCTQQLYGEILSTLEARGLDPGVITLDDKWQAVYGLARPDLRRWPDLPGFIAAQHARGRRVLLWWKLWDGEGLPAEELLPGGDRPVVDPESPSYRARLAHEVRYALRELDADGFKIDFLHRGPTLAHGPSRSGLQGTLLLRSMLEAMREPALEAKADCLLVAHAVNPYLADLVDAVRLNDISCPPEGVDTILGEMRHRARIAGAACPEALIDADNWPCPNRALWAEYVAGQPEIGIPSLYYATGIDLSGEAFRDEDYALVRESWARWRASRR